MSDRFWAPRDKVKRSAMMRYYMEYFTHMMAPSGIDPGFRGCVLGIVARGSPYGGGP